MKLFEIQAISGNFSLSHAVALLSQLHIKTQVLPILQQRLCEQYSKDSLGYIAAILRLTPSWEAGWAQLLELTKPPYDLLNTPVELPYPNATAKMHGQRVSLLGVLPVSSSQWCRAPGVISHLVHLITPHISPNELQMYGWSRRARGCVDLLNSFVTSYPEYLSSEDLQLIGEAVGCCDVCGKPNKLTSERSDYGAGHRLCLARQTKELVIKKICEHFPDLDPNDYNTQRYLRYFFNRLNQGSNGIDVDTEPLTTGLVSQVVQDV